MTLTPGVEPTPALLDNKPGFTAATVHVGSLPYDRNSTHGYIIRPEKHSRSLNNMSAHGLLLTSSVATSPIATIMRKQSRGKSRRGQRVWAPATVTAWTQLPRMQRPTGGDNYDDVELSE